MSTSSTTGHTYAHADSQILRMSAQIIRMCTALMLLSRSVHVWSAQTKHTLCQNLTVNKASLPVALVLHVELCASDRISKLWQESSVQPESLPETAVPANKYTLRSKYENIFMFVFVKFVWLLWCMSAFVYLVFVVFGLRMTTSRWGVRRAVRGILKENPQLTVHSLKLVNYQCWEKMRL